MSRRTIALLAFTAACGDSNSATVDGNTDGSGDAAPGSCMLGSGWSTTPSVLGGAIQETAVVALDGKIYVLGGFDASIAVVRSVRIFDTAACTWSDGPQLPKAVHHANAAVENGTIYVVGSMQGTSFTAIGDVWSWKPATETAWTVKTSMPAGSERGAAVAGAIAGKIYVAGGLRGGAQTTLSAYDIAGDSWDTALPALSVARDHGCGGAVGGKLYVIGGRSASITSQSNQVYEYTPGGAWALRAPMPTARGGTSCGIAADRIVTAGGEGNGMVSSGVFPQVEVYDVASNSWSALPDMKTPRHGTGSAVWNGVLYIPGGATVQAFGAVDTHEALKL